jgi:heptosyltransferase-2
MHVALIKTGALGDVVRTTALVPGLLRLDPDARITWITAPGALDLVRHHPGVARAASIADGPDAPWRRDRYDRIVSLDDGDQEGRLASPLAARGGRLSGAYQAPDGRRLYTPDLDAWFGMGVLRPEGQGGLTAANALKARNGRTVAEILHDGLGLPGPVGRPLVPVPAPDARAADDRLDAAGLLGRRPLVGLNTGAGARWRLKSWGEGQTAELARRLADDRGAAVVVLGGPAEGDRNARIVAEAGRPGRVVAGPIDLPLLGFAAILARLDLLVTSDSLALHLAVSQGTPVVAFFGPTSSAEIALHGLGEKVVTPLPCRCCYLRDCDVRPDCMRSIPVESLLSAALRRLPATTSQLGLNP